MKRTKQTSTTPLVSVLIPVYNGAQYLDEALESVLQSSYPHLEIILVDDGSTDTSKARCRWYEKQHKHVSFYSFKQNKGMTRCLNFGIKKAKGKYIARFNQDDIMVPDRLEKQVAFLEAHPDHVVVGGAITLIHEDGSEMDTLSFPRTDAAIRKQWMLFSPYSDPTVMYHKSAWEQTDGYSQFFWPADDVHMWYELGSVGKLANLPDVLTIVRWHHNCGSIISHKRQMYKTWQVHNWAAEMVQAPTILERLFWLGQLIAGHVFTPEFNWRVYRSLRKMQTAVKPTAFKIVSKIALQR